MLEPQQRAGSETKEEHSFGRGCEGDRPPRMELVGPDCSARQASGTRGLLLGFQVLLNLFKFFSQVWHFIVLSQIHSNHVAQSKSKREDFAKSSQ